MQEIADKEIDDLLEMVVTERSKAPYASLLVLVKKPDNTYIPPLNLKELKEEKAVQFAAEVSNRFTALEAAHAEVTPEDLWKGTKIVLLEVARETIRSVKSQKKKKWISNDTYAVIREKERSKRQR